MKKSVLALAVLGTFAGVASAQGSVTLFGVVDLNVRYVNNDASMYQLAQDGMSSSRLGFRGVEDLGGGLKASFWLEGALGPDTGLGGSSVGNSSRSTNAYAFQRRSTLSLSNQWGELRLGRDYTSTFWNWTVFDPFGTNGVGAATNLGLGADIRNATSSTNAFGTLVRANNMVAYILPAGQFGPGLYGQVQVAAGENDILNKYFGGRIGYSAGPFNVAAAYGMTETGVNDIDMDNWNIGGSWDFKFLKLSAFYGEISLDTAVKYKQENWYIGVSAPLGQANLKASYGAVNVSGPAAVNGNDASQWAIGADYNLSKRTAFYVTLSGINNDRLANYVVAPGAPLTGGNNSTGGEVGIRHTF
jgi:predicted porin